ncbi:MAG TPA: hypothetical protein VF897_07435 [Roseiflexaceae bacterium]
MELAPIFSVGDRVQTVRSLDGIPSGSIGSILTQFARSDLYDVRFDGCAAPRVVHCRILAPATANAHVAETR